MARKELRPYHESGSGVVEIGAFRADAKWEETGKRVFHFAENMEGAHWVEGLPEHVEWRIEFGQLSPSDAAALLSALSKWEQDRYSTFSIKLGGKPRDTLYLHRLTEKPLSLVFSNRPPR